MVMRRPPDGYAIIKKGTLTRKDLVWCTYKASWVNPNGADLATFGYDVTNYHAVARQL